MKNYFITGTDTDAGKTFVTALIADYFTKKNIKVITQKWVQTGDENDLKVHGILGDEAIRCPYTFKFPASPHLSASLENKKIDKNYIIDCYKKLSQKYESVLVEGSGGVLVPFSDDGFLIDIVKELGLETILVSLNKLGSINHTLLSIEALKSRGIKIKGVIFNNAPNTDELILKNNIETIRKFTDIAVIENFGELLC